MCALSKIFHIKGTYLEYVSEMCNITPLEVEIAIRQRHFHRKLWDLVAEWHSRWSCVSYFICLSVVTVILLCFLLCSLVLSSWQNKVYTYTLPGHKLVTIHQHGGCVQMYTRSQQQKP